MFMHLSVQNVIIVLFCCHRHLTFNNNLYKDQKCVGIGTDTGNNQLIGRLIWASGFRDFTK